jgi:ribosome biogenesis GTPase
LNILFCFGLKGEAAEAMTVPAHADHDLARVVAEHKNSFLVSLPDDLAGAPQPAKLSGKFGFQTVSRLDLPAVGDFVLLRRTAAHEQDADWRVIEKLLPRRGALVRKASGGGLQEQVVAANVDTVFIVNSMNHDLNERRIERYLTMVWNSGAVPVVLLTKADACENPASAGRKFMFSKSRTANQGKREGARCG